ncbi:uncharacterized protein LOC110275215 [Arachis duranensis]|uniref:ATP-dependent DNA helicase n=1 Tax=Arachis duranensis TaxID=130453 RepID=A0A6P5MNL3_ARADU|nr:uncharacterized protein LOC110275215 [Arachis duranensis]
MCFEALDQTLRNLMSVTNQHKTHQPFGDKVVILGGDFRQILSVIPKGSRHDILTSAINSSHMWSFCEVLKLHMNIRLLTPSSDQDEGEMKRFNNWILDFGNGNISSAVDFAYPNLLKNMSDYRYFQSRTILAPTLESVEKVNDFVLTIFPGMEKEYLSSDTTCQVVENENIQQKWFTPEFLNDIKCSGLPNHKLTLKPGVAVMLLRNIDQTSRLCNGTRLIFRFEIKCVTRSTTTYTNYFSNEIKALVSKYNHMVILFTSRLLHTAMHNRPDAGRSCPGAGVSQRSCPRHSLQTYYAIR